jgi:hypothetical protein
VPESWYFVSRISPATRLRLLCRSHSRCGTSRYPSWKLWIGATGQWRSKPISFHHLPSPYHPATMPSSSSVHHASCVADTVDYAIGRPSGSTCPSTVGIQLSPSWLQTLSTVQRSQPPSSPHHWFTSTEQSLISTSTA